jgi:hypothetical protein
LRKHIKVAVANYARPTLIECIIDGDDASADLIFLGSPSSKSQRPAASTAIRREQE